MSGELGAVVRQMFDALDAKDAGGVMQTAAADMQAIDEISRRWMRGAGDIGSYIGETLDQIEVISTQLRDIHENVWGDAGILTCWIDQDYTYQGVQQHVSAPTTVVLRRGADGWRIALFHSLPLPEEETS